MELPDKSMLADTTNNELVEIILRTNHAISEAGDEVTILARKDYHSLIGMAALGVASLKLIKREEEDSDA